jgi:hypothetical protein
VPAALESDAVTPKPLGSSPKVVVVVPLEKPCEEVVVALAEFGPVVAVTADISLPATTVPPEL